MRVRELTLLNYRVFDAPPPFQFADRFTVIAGINGKGKTALLDAIALLCSRLIPLISPARSGYRRVMDSDVHSGALAAQLSMKVNCAGIPVEYQLTYNKTDHQVTTTQLSRALRNEVRKKYGDPNRTDDAAPLVVYYTVDRAGYRLPRKLPEELPAGQEAAYVGALFNRTVNFRDFMARYRSMITLQNEQRQLNPSYIGERAVAAISRVLSTFLGGFDDLRVEEDPIRLMVNKSGVSFDLSQLSDGERSFLAVICDICRRLALANPMLEDPLLGAGVILIDELELHLHPNWQREVADKLRLTFPNIQFIATTHSPFIIQSLRSAELINLDPEEFAEYSDKSIEDIAENIMGVEVPQKSERYLQMVATAEEYFRLLQTASKKTKPEIEKLRSELDRLSEPYSDDPAYMALLRLERRAALPSVPIIGETLGPI